ncbi:MAG: DUF1329 domain-containing protein [Cycloclasticus sp.]
MKISKLFKYGVSALVLASASTLVLAKVPQVGDVIDASNVDDYSDYMIEAAIELVKKGQVLKVTPTSKKGSLINPYFAELTEKNRGKAKLLDEYGTVGLEDGSPWPGGAPFPEPETALELMVNFQFSNLSTEADQWSSKGGPYKPVSRFFYINSDAKVYKTALMAGGQIQMTSRMVIDPVPSVPGHEDEYLRRYLYFLAPYDVQGIVTLDIQYRDQSKLPEAYVYLPSFRRVRQVSAANRADSVAGSELSQSDLGGFSDPLGLWKYKIIEKKKMLVSVTDAVYAPPHPEPPTFLNGYFPEQQRPMQLRETFVIEATPRFDTIYSKKIITFDAEVFRLSDVGAYDLQGKLYKAIQQDWNIQQDPGPYNVAPWLLIYNFQTAGATVLSNDGLKVNAEISADLFEKSNMKNFAR